MKPLLLLAAALLLPHTASTATQRNFRYERKLILSPGTAPEACAVLDASVFAHAASESLSDLRLYAQPSLIEEPFDISISGTQTDEDDTVATSHVHATGNNIAFDLKMPPHPYSAVVLTLTAHDFLATAVVTGISQTKTAPTNLGTFALFDLSAQHLSRDTTLPLQESTFPVLHVQLHLTAAPESAPQVFAASIVQDAIVPPSREAQTLYTPVLSTSIFTQQGTDTVATIHVPAHVPVQRLRIQFSPRFKGNFQRSVQVIATPDDAHNVSATEVFSGKISHVLLPQTIRNLPIDSLQNTIEMPLGANLRSGATLMIRIHNGSASPLPLTLVQLQMRQLQLCFHPASSAASYLLLYGDPTLHAPDYAYAQTFAPTASPTLVTLAPEQRNPAYKPSTEDPERYPDLPWVLLLAVLATLGSIALRRSHSRRD